MNEAQLIPVFTGEIQDQSHQMCNARDLWQFLEIKSKFADWIRIRIDEYGFVEGEDFKEVFLKFENNPSGGRPTRNYHLTLDTAKELAMVEKNDRGRQVRRYFIAMENRARELSQGSVPTLRHQLAAHGIRLRLLDKLEVERHPEKRLAIHQQLEHASRMLGLPTPAMDAIGFASACPTPSAQAANFWDVFRQLRADGNEPLNHARDARLLAINLPQVARLAARLGLAIPPRPALTQALRASVEPRFIGLRAINSVILRRTAKCWVFDAPTPHNEGAEIPLRLP